MTEGLTVIKRGVASLGTALRTEQLRGLAGELQGLRHCPPLVRKANGKYEGDILGFVKGLRFSARVAYFLREQLPKGSCEVSWGHLLDAEERSCSPECDIIVHREGLVRKWNDHKTPIMEFAFVSAEKALAVVSCKSVLKQIDEQYSKSLESYGVKHVILFAESCPQRRLAALRAKALSAGYKGLWCLYTTAKDGSFLDINEQDYVDFLEAVKGTLL
jgi:hypothetical protein